MAYMYYNGYIFVTTNLNACANVRCSGLKWTRIQFPQVAANPNRKTKILGPMMAVDPANDDIVYAGTLSTGLFKTANGTSGSLSTWSPVTPVGAGNTSGSRYFANLDQGGGNLICFDPTSAISGGVTQEIFVSTYGTARLPFWWRDVGQDSKWPNDRTFTCFVTRTARFG